MDFQCDFLTISNIEIGSDKEITGQHLKVISEKTLFSITSL